MVPHMPALHPASLLGLALAAATLGRLAPADDVDFQAEVRPILEARCFECHGPDKQKAGLRFDIRDAALAGSGFGERPVIVPGDSAASELIVRLAPEFEDEQMPPKGDPLSPDEIATLTRWIDEGAHWPEDGASDVDWKHWAYVAPVRGEVAEGVHPVDHYIHAALERTGLEPLPAEERAVLLRRVTLDLTGLPPTVAELDAFLGDDSPSAYEAVVLRLLASPRFGEHWARPWLDLARYADTKGFEKDDRRNIWRYRDWVIEAFNSGMPFDQFTILQLAGDLLPDAQPEQILATAFHRNTMTNDEGGTDDEEFRVEAIVDRVNTTMQTWMGTTMNCAQCHDHKYDPLKQREYYQLFAFFNQTADADRPDESPLLAVPSARELRAIAEIQSEITRLEESVLAEDRELDAGRAAWEDSARELLASNGAGEQEWSAWSHSGPYPAESGPVAFRTVFAPEPGSAADAEALPWTERPDYEDGQAFTDLAGLNCAHYLQRTVELSVAQELVLSLGSDDTLTVWVNGERVHEREVYRAVAPDQEIVTARLQAGKSTILLKVCNGGGPAGFYFAVRGDGLPDDVRAGLLAAPGAPEHEPALHAYFRSIAPELAETRARIASLEAESAALRSPPIPIMTELAPDMQRKTHIHERGSFLSPGDEVQPGVPAVFADFPEDAPRNRLGFARWLVAPENPLTARVTVNRFWEQLFGTGIVESPGDFGTMAEPPSHPELLDWLAVEFVESGWNVKDLLGLLVMSDTYKRSANSTPELVAADPYNRLYARGPRFRLKAETVRDQALAIAGLLSDKMFGPSVMPPQPEGVWQVVYSGDSWQTSEGEDRYRRGLYTFWRRTSPYPSLMAFDAPSREVCSARRIRTNTPLQALVTLNDPVYVEAAQAFARRIMTEGGDATDERVHWAFRACVSREPSATEAARLSELLQGEWDFFSDQPEMAAELSGAEAQGTAPEHAAWTVVSNVLLNLDELLTKG